MLQLLPCLHSIGDTYKYTLFPINFKRPTKAKLVMLHIMKSMSSLFINFCLISRKIDHCTHCKTITHFPNSMIRALYPVLLPISILFKILLKTTIQH